MTLKLSDQQRKYAEHVLMFDRPFSSELQEAIHRATLACHENKLSQTGVIEFICGLYLQCGRDMQVHFDGDVAAVVARVFPKHRFNEEGLVPGSILEKAASEGESCGSGVMYEIDFSDDLIQLLWQAMRTSNAVGKKPSLKDAIAALASSNEWLELLEQYGLRFSRKLADFASVLNVVFHATTHMNEAWPRQLDFQVDPHFRAPFTATIKTPSGGFQPLRSAIIKLNDNEIARLAWPSQAYVTVPVELRSNNTIKLDVDGPHFGSMEITIRGVVPKSERNSDR